MNSIKTAQIAAETFNKSRAIIAGLISKDTRIENQFLSYDKDYGIYPVLAKVLYSPLTPHAVLEEFPSDKNGDRVPAFAGELFGKDKFSSVRLAAIKAEHDGSFFSFVQRAAIRLIQDKQRSMCSNALAQSSSIDNTYGLVAEDRHRKYEAHDLLKHIIKDARLNEFQQFIIDHLLEEFEPQEIVKAYSAKKKKALTMNYYYAQASLAMKSLKMASRNYSWC